MNTLKKLAHRLWSKGCHIYHFFAFRRHKYLHVMNNGIHSVGFLEFIKRNFDEKEHGFIFPVMTYATRTKLSDVPYVYSYSLDGLSCNGDYKIVFHGIFSDDVVKYLYNNRRLLEKSYWCIWGGDLYNAIDDECHNFVRKGFAGILTSFDQDVYLRRYGLNNFYDVTYPHALSEEMLYGNVKETREFVHIQVNNSADETTLEMLDILSRFKVEKIKISTILSYISNGQQDSRLEIIRKGYEIFGDKFNPIINFMPEEDYAKHLATVDVYISNQNRQQGNGNAAFVCSLGGKVYIKSDVSVYKKYNNLGIRYYDTDSIKDLSFLDFISQDKLEKEQTIERLKKRMNELSKVEQWECFFKKVSVRSVRFYERLGLPIKL